ncbi:endonuclease/exonuclease/phosphatase family protein [Dasania marina]|uniref:endonuclease/exonuclease/phosphatase family protein n=1 Tax=Dasania marina TaxID=471499 RepID=UPI000381B4A6|nr:endonuclease/exonuclease/phosphatase family protein [Dasania marina]
MSKIIKCLSYNIHKGFSTSNRRYLLSEIRHAIRDADADLVFLQEVLGRHDKHENKHSHWPKESQFEFLADQIWPHYAYGKNASYQHGHHGNAILSKQAFSEWHNKDVSKWQFSQRGILHGVIADSIYVYCVHLGLFGLERNYQYKKLLQFIERSCPKDAPLIIAGDFNDWQGKLDKKLQSQLNISDVHHQHTGKLALSFPAILPIFPMDRMYTRGFSVLHAEVLNQGHWQRLSDHCALYSELTLD